MQTLNLKKLGITQSEVLSFEEKKKIFGGSSKMTLSLSDKSCDTQCVYNCVYNCEVECYSNGGGDYCIDACNNACLAPCGC